MGEGSAADCACVECGGVNKCVKHEIIFVMLVCLLLTPYHAPLHSLTQNRRVFACCHAARISKASSSYLHRGNGFSRKLLLTAVCCSTLAPKVVRAVHTIEQNTEPFTPVFPRPSSATVQEHARQETNYFRRKTKQQRNQRSNKQ